MSFYDRETTRRCECEGMGCDECGGTGRIILEQPAVEDEFGTLAEPFQAFFATAQANLRRAEASGYENTPEQFSIPEARLALAFNEAGITAYEQQHQIGPFFADFYFPETATVVEVDGAAYHQDAEKDEHRSAYMLARGASRVLRVRALEVMADPDGCAQRLAAEAKK